MLLQEVVALLLVKVFTRLVADVGLQVLQVDFAVQHLHGGKQALLHRLCFQEHHFVLDAERHVRAGEVQRHDVVRDVLHGKRGLVGYLVAHVDVVVHLFAQVLHSGAELLVTFLGAYLGCGLHMSCQVGFVADDVYQLHSSQSLDDSRDVTVRQRQLLDDLGKDAIFV